MSAAFTILFLSLVMEKSGGAIKPVVTFTPNWGNILHGDSVNITCDVLSTEEPRTYHWYKDNQPIPGDQQSLHRTSYGEQDRGDYQCRAGDGDISDTVTLNVTNNFVILQRPPSAIYEGDPLTLRCHHIKDYRSDQPKFFKNNEEIKSQFLDSELRIQKVDLNTTGHYKCTKQIAHPGSSDYHEFSDEFSVSVKEIFSPPEIKVTPSRVIEGDEMTVRCDTRLDPLRGGTELYFAFYSDEETVQDFDVSDTYRVPSSQLEDSGNYTCEVRTTSDTVRKMSDGIYIRVYSRQIYVTILAVAIVGVLLIIVLSAVLIWRCKYRKGSPQEADTMATDENPNPEDVCYTYLELSHLPKGNKIRKDELTVTYATVRDPDI